MLTINAAAKRLNQPYLLVSGFVYGMRLPLVQDGKSNMMTEEGFEQLKDMMENRRYETVQKETTPKPKYRWKKKPAAGPVPELTVDLLKAVEQAAERKALTPQEPPAAKLSVAAVKRINAHAAKALKAKAQPKAVALKPRNRSGQPLV